MTPNFTLNFTPNVLHIMKTVEESGHDIYMVGGCVRDYLMKQPCKDVDFATSCPMEKLEELFNCHDIGANKAFGIVVANVKGENFEIAQFRSEGDYSDGRHPNTVQLGVTFKEDVLRRDFTINALGMDMMGNIIDHVDGLLDIMNNTIKCVGDPNKRFKEDGLRILRLFRFAARFKFSVDPITLDAAQRNVHMLNELSKERISEEIMKVASYGGKTFANYIMLLNMYNIIGHIHPFLENLMNTKYQQNKAHHPEGDVGIHTLGCLKALETNDPITVIATFLHDIGKPACFEVEKDDSFEEGYRYKYNGHDKKGAEMIKQFCSDLKFSNEVRDTCMYVAEQHMIFHNVMNMRKSKVINMMNNPYFGILKDVSEADAKSRGVLFKKEERNKTDEFLKKIRDNMPSEEEVRIRKMINGHKIILICNAEGPEIGRIKKEVTAWALDSEKWVSEDMIVEKLQEYKSTNIKK